MLIKMLGYRGCIASYALCFLVFQVKLSYSSYSFKLVGDKIISSEPPELSPEEQRMMKIITGVTRLPNGGWIVTAPSSSATSADKVFCHNCKGYVNVEAHDRRFPEYGPANTTDQNYGSNQQQKSCSLAGQSCDDIVLDCGKPVNFTYYDNLLGVSNRQKHPLVPEPDVAYMFFKSDESLVNFNIDLLEQRLKKAKREKPKSVQLYNQIGNFWRIKGNAQRSIECFRRALAVSPHNAEVLLNLARVLMVLEYLDDATHLARRSLELQPPDRSSWEQYFTLGQIYKAYGHFQEAAAHLRQALDLKPGQIQIMKALKDIETLPVASIHVWTLVIIVLLIFLALLLVLSSIDTEDSTLSAEQVQRPPQRHFNRAMAMRNLRNSRRN